MKVLCHLAVAAFAVALIALTLIALTHWAFACGTCSRNEAAIEAARATPCPDRPAPPVTLRSPHKPPDAIERLTRAMHTARHCGEILERTQLGRVTMGDLALLHECRS